MVKHKITKYGTVVVQYETLFLSYNFLSDCLALTPYTSYRN